MFKLLHKIMRLAGYVPVREKNRLVREILLLEQENDKLIKDLDGLQDENGSLWDMLDEIKKSDVAEHMKTQANLQTVMDEIKDVMTNEMLKDFKPVGEA